MSDGTKPPFSGTRSACDEDVDQIRSAPVEMPPTIRLRSGVDVWRCLDGVMGTASFASPRPDASSLAISLTATPSVTSLRSELTDLRRACLDPLQPGSHFNFPGLADSFIATSNISMDCRHSYTVTLWMNLSAEQPNEPSVLFSCSAHQFSAAITCSLSFDTEGQAMVVFSTSMDQSDSPIKSGSRGVKNIVGFVPARSNHWHMWRITHNAASSIVAVFLDEELQFIGDLVYPFKGCAETQFVWTFGSGIKGRISEIALFSGDVSSDLLRYILEAGPTAHMVDRLGCAHSHYHSSIADAAMGTLFSKMQYSARVTSAPSVVLTAHHFPVEIDDETVSDRCAWALCETPSGRAVDPEYLEFEGRFPRVDRTTTCRMMGEVEVSSALSPLQCWEAAGGPSLVFLALWTSTQAVLKDASKTADEKAVIINTDFMTAIELIGVLISKSLVLRDMFIQEHGFELVSYYLQTVHDSVRLLSRFHVDQCLVLVKSLGSDGSPGSALSSALSGLLLDLNLWSHLPFPDRTYLIGCICDLGLWVGKELYCSFGIPGVVSFIRRTIMSGTHKNYGSNELENAHVVADRTMELVVRAGLDLIKQLGSGSRARQPARVFNESVFSDATVLKMVCTLLHSVYDTRSQELVQVLLEKVFSFTSLGPEDLSRALYSSRFYDLISVHLLMNEKWRPVVGTYVMGLFIWGMNTVDMSLNSDIYFILKRLHRPKQSDKELTYDEVTIHEGLMDDGNWISRPQAVCYKGLEGRAKVLNRIWILSGLVSVLFRDNIAAYNALGKNSPPPLEDRNIERACHYIVDNLAQGRYQCWSVLPWVPPLFLLADAPLRRLLARALSLSLGREQELMCICLIPDGFYVNYLLDVILATWLTAFRENEDFAQEHSVFIVRLGDSARKSPGIVYDDLGENGSKNKEAFYVVDVLITVLVRIICYQTIHFGKQGKLGLVRAVNGIESLVAESFGREKLLTHLLMRVLVLIQNNECGHNRWLSLLLKRSFEVIERNKLCNVVCLPNFARIISFSNPVARSNAAPLSVQQTSFLMLCLESSKRLRVDSEGIMIGAQSPESRAMYFMTRLLIGCLHGADSELSSLILKELEAIVVFSIDYWGYFDVGVYRLFILGILSELRVIILSTDLGDDVRIGCKLLVGTIARLFFAMRSADLGKYSQLSSILKIFSDTGRCGTVEVLFAALASKFPVEGVTDPAGVQSDRDLSVLYASIAVDCSEPPFFDVTGRNIPPAEWSEELMQMTVYPNMFTSALDCEQSADGKFTDRWMELRKGLISQRQEEERALYRKIERYGTGGRKATEVFWTDLSSKLERDCFGIREVQIWSIGDGFEGPIPGRKRTILSPYSQGLEDDSDSEASSARNSPAKPVVVREASPAEDADADADAVAYDEEEIMKHLLHQASNALQPESNSALDKSTTSSEVNDQKLTNRDWNIIEVDNADENGGAYSDAMSEITTITGSRTMSPSNASDSVNVDSGVATPDIDGVSLSSQTLNRNDVVDVSISESPMLKGVSVVMVTPAGSIKGIISFTHAEIFFDTTDQLLFEHEEHGLILPELRDIKHRQWSISSIHGIYLRNYRLRPSAVEILFNRGKYRSLFADFGFSAENLEARNKFVEAILQIAPRHAMKQWPGTTFSQLISGHEVTQEWCNGRVSNFDYLMYLNTIAGRSFNDLCQYPVMPWVIAQYTEDSIDLKSASTYRDLTKPMGAINPERLEIILERYHALCETDQSIPPFMYGSHYSTMAGVVMHYLIRLQPFTSLHKHLQGGRYDTYDRMFSSIPATFEQNCTRTSEVKELTPEWFSLPDFLRNVNNLNIMGRRGNAPIESVKNGDVELPKWAASPEDFIRINRAALESDYVSANLNHWIDLIFGYKQRGQAAIEANNLFYYLTYYGAVDFDKLDPVTLEIVNAQITHFGQCPSQVFDRPHPKKRMRIRVIPRPFWKCFDSDVGTSQTLSYGFVTPYGKDESLIQSRRLNAVRSLSIDQKSPRCSVVVDLRLYGNTVLCLRADGGVFAFNHEVSAEVKGSIRWPNGLEVHGDLKGSSASEIDEVASLRSPSSHESLPNSPAVSRLSVGSTSMIQSPLSPKSSAFKEFSKPVIEVYCDPLLNDMSPWFSGEKDLSDRFVPLMCGRGGPIADLNVMSSTHFVHTADNIVLTSGRSDGVVYINRLDHDSGVPVEQAYFNAHISAVTCMASDHWALETHVTTIASCDSSGVLMLWTIKRTLSTYQGKRYLISRRPHRVFRGLASPSASCDISLVLGIAILATCNIISIFSIDLDIKLLDIHVLNSINSSRGDFESCGACVCNLRRVAMSDSGTIVAYIEKFASSDESYDSITHIIAAYSIAGRVTSLIELPFAVTHMSCPNRGEITMCGLADGTLLFMRSSNLEIVYNSRPREECGFITVLSQNGPGLPPTVSAFAQKPMDLEASSSNLSASKSNSTGTTESDIEGKAILSVRVGPRLDRPALVVASDASGLVYMIPLPDYVKWDRDHKLTLDMGDIVTKPVTSIINTWKSAHDLTLDAGASIVNGAATIGGLFSKMLSLCIDDLLSFEVMRLQIAFQNSDSCLMSEFNGMELELNFYEENYKIYLAMNPVWESAENRRRGLRLGFNYWMERAMASTNPPGGLVQCDASRQALDICPEDIIDLIRSVITSAVHQDAIPVPGFVDIGADSDPNIEVKIPHSVCVVALQGAGAVRLSDYLTALPSAYPPSIPASPQMQSSAWTHEASAEDALKARVVYTSTSPSFLSTCSRFPIAYAHMDDAALSTTSVRGATALLLWPQTMHLFGESRGYSGFSALGNFLGAHTVHFQCRHVLWNDTVVLRPLSTSAVSSSTSADTSPLTAESIYARAEVRRAVGEPSDGDVVGTYSRSKQRDSGVYVLRWADDCHMLYLWDITTAELLVLRTPITHAIELETLGCLPLFVSKVTALFRDRYIPICEMFMDHYYPVCVKTTHSVNLRRGEPLDTSDSMDPACIANGNSDDDDLLSDNENAPRVKRMKVEPSIAASSCSPAAEQTECPRSPRPPDKYSCIGKTSTKYASELRSLGLFYSYLDPSRLDELLVSSRLRCMNGYPEVADFWGTESVYVSVIHSVIGGELVRLNKTVWSAAQLFSCDAFLDIESDYSSFSTVACMDRVEKAAAIAPEIEEGEEEEGADGEDRLSPGPTLTDDSCNKSPGYEVLENFYLSARRGRCIEPLKLCAIDCEMCETAEGLCLTRFTLISPEYGALIDCFIQPREKITNYWTEFSGISETDLENVTSTVGDLHKLLADYNIIAGSTVVIGHSLESDLKAARLVHRKIIDSSLLYPHEKGFPHKHSLKYLAEMYLGKSIQEGCKGHDSIEDAIIALELVAHHLNNHSGGDVRVWPREHRVSLFDRECIGSSAESPIHVAMFGCSTIHSSSERRFLASAWETRVYEHSAENDCCDSITWMRQNKLSASEGIVAMAKKSYHAEDALKACLDYLTTVKGESGGPRRRFTWLDLPIEVIDAGTDVGPVQLHSMQEADVALASIFDALPTGTLLIALTQGSLEVLRYLSAIKQRTKWENDAGRQHRGVAFTRGLAPWAAGSDEMELMRVLQDVSNGTVFLRLK